MKKKYLMNETQDVSGKAGSYMTSCLSGALTRKGGPGIKNVNIAYCPQTILIGVKLSAKNLFSKYTYILSIHCCYKD